MKSKIGSILAGVLLVGSMAVAVARPGPAVIGAETDVGIPPSNPVFHPDEDGNCEKHESGTKTTPNGKTVTVPCHAAEHGGGNGHGSGHGNH